MTLIVYRGHPDMRGSRWGHGFQTPHQENYEAIRLGSLSNTRPDHLENHNANKPTFNGGVLSARQQNAF